jgi:DNA-binding PadR family transcriptional regulator
MNYMAFEPGIWEIAVLALLREAPMHPYQMQRLLRLRHKDELLVLKRGSLYHAIGRLARAGLIAVKATGRDGKRPERTTYRITPAGREALVKAIRDMLATPRRESSAFMAAVSFLVFVDQDEALRQLEERIRSLKAEVEQLTAGLASASAHVLRIHLIESEYLLAMIKAELLWVQETAKEIRAGKLAWDLEEIFRGASASRDAAGKKGSRS